jgi:hypothetical protein
MLPLGAPDQSVREPQLQLTSSRSVRAVLAARRADYPTRELLEERIYVGFAAAVATYQLFLKVVLDVVQCPPLG